MKLKNAKRNGKKKTRTGAPRAERVELGQGGDPQKRRVAAISYDDFVKAWSGAGSLVEVAEALGIKRNSASAIASRLRKAGVVNLRSFPRRGSQLIDVKRLNKIASGKAD